MALEAFKSGLKTVGEYDVLDKIAEGGMGTVYRGKHQQSGQIVAIKVVPSHLTSNQVLLKRFENEFRAASKLDHPNIVRALDYGTVSGRPYLVMEFIDGESLGQTLERVGKLSEDEAIKIISEAVKGLEEAHRNGMIHRDIKPDNIMVTRDGKVKIADLGLVKDIEGEMNLTRTGRGLGTPHFMAPEQFRNAKNADVRCDIYSLAATLYMMVTGELPFKSCGPLDAWMKKAKNDLPPARKLNPALSERIDAAIRRAMDAEPTKRPQSVREFYNDASSGDAPAGAAAKSDPGSEIWYMVYKETDGSPRTVKGPAATIRAKFKEGLLGDPNHIRVSRTKTGTFHHINSCPEFRDLFDPHAAAAAPGPATPLSDASGDSVLEVGSNRTAEDVAAPATSSSALGDALKLAALALVAMGVALLVIYFTRK